jgi:hypothetical protein
MCHVEGQPPHHSPDNTGYPNPAYSGPPPGGQEGPAPGHGYVPPHAPSHMPHPGEGYPPGTPPVYAPPPYTSYMPQPGEGYGPPNQPYMTPPPPPMPARSGIPWWGWLLGGCLGVLIIGVIACGIIGATLGARLGGVISSIANEQYVTDTSTQTFPVTGTPSIIVDNAAGNVTYQTGTGNTVSVQITRRAGDSSTSAAQSDLQSINATASQSGNTITIHTDLGAGVQGLGRTLNVDLLITGPASATIDVTNQAGNVTLSGVQGLVQTNVQAGNVDLTSVTLASGSRLQTDVGTITLNGQLAPGASVDITANVGSVAVTLPASTNTHLSAKANTGSVTITGWSVQPTSQGVGGSATGDLGTNPTGALTIQVNTGSITLTAAS